MWSTLRLVLDRRLEKASGISADDADLALHHLNGFRRVNEVITVLKQQRIGTNRKKSVGLSARPKLLPNGVRLLSANDEQISAALSTKRFRENCRVINRRAQPAKH
jgi:hypothetical protein